MTLTDMHNMLMLMSEELRETKQELGETKHRQLVTEKDLNDTREILNIGNLMTNIDGEHNLIYNLW